MAETSAAGSMSSGSVKEVQKSISKLASDMAKIEASAKAFATSMRSASKSAAATRLGRGGGGGGGGNYAGSAGSGGGGGFTTQSLHAGGYGPGQGIQAGDITDTGSMNPERATPSSGMLKQLGLTGLKAVAGMSIGMINDLRPTAQQEADWEWNSRRARSMTGDYSRWRGNVLTGMNAYNILDKDQYMSNLAEVYHMGGAGAMGIGRGGNTAGERLAALNVGSFQSIAAMNGMTSESVVPAYKGIFSSQAYYKALAGGIQTRAANGRQVSIEEIANQYYNTRYKGKSADELETMFSYGEANMAELENTFGSEGADYIRSSIMERARAGHDLTPTTTEADLRASGAAGTDATRNLDSSAGLNRAQVEVLGEYAPDVAKGVGGVNDALTTLNTNLANLEGNFRKIAGWIAEAGGGADAAATHMPDTMGAAMSGLSAVGGLLGGWALSKAGGALSRLFKGGGGTSAAAAAEDTAAAAGEGGSAYGAVAETAAKTGILRTLGRAAGPLGMAVSGYESYQIGKDMWEAHKEGQSFSDIRDTGATSLYNLLNSGGMKYNPLTALPSAAMRKMLDWMPFNIHKDGKAKGDWFVEADQDARIHTGEMVLPSRIAQSVRNELDSGRRAKGGGRTVIINLTVSTASDQEAMRFASRIKKILDDDSELIAAGNGVLS